LLLALLAVSLAGNVTLGYLWLKSNQTVAPGAQSARNTPEIGSTIDELSLLRLDGQVETIRFDGGGSSTLIYVFTPSCKWCERNLSNLRALSTAARENGIRFIGVSLDPAVQPYVERNQLDFPIYVAPVETARRYGLGATPETFVFENDGTVLKHWRGAYAGPTLKEVEQWIGRTLPGLEDGTP
jgi:peroxiredoxin